jgi:hypothetical protein
MAIKDNLGEEFLKALNDINLVLITLGFKRHSFFEKGLAYYIDYENISNTRVEFFFGPSDWDIEMIIYSSKGRFAFKDLLDIHEINKWVTDNKYEQKNERDLKNELMWFVSLLKISLPYVE